jgi:SAM-dependent methyltransferase
MLRRPAYDHAYYEMLQEGTRRSARVILPGIMDLLSPRSAVDLGCGSGGWLATFLELGGEHILGVDGPWVDPSTLQIPADRFQVADLGSGFTAPQRFDLAMSLEVAEHLPESAMEPFVKSLVGLAPAVLFSASVPDQGGTGHINERWQADWAARFERRGYTAIDAIRPVHWNDRSVEFWYLQNTLLYVDETLAAQPAIEAAKRETAGMPLSVVHPRTFAYALSQERSRGVRRVARTVKRRVLRRR